jgi:hypothetical protein
VLDNAQTRAAGIKGIDAALDLGGGLTMAAFNTAIGNARTALDEFSVVDDKLNAFVAAETTLRDISERILAGVAARYGKNSSQYEQAGGVRKSERKRPVRKAKGPSGS